ncbi:hypothetical protein [Fimbriiglobus ruber]|uniref:hypothetical protein n=1 Tax=Fimbriiglobus ruber TaxID=1908690 RepID=UPI000B4BBAF7|nr:hypothetical protein [Fimbriiglobus ruber]
MNAWLKLTGAVSGREILVNLDHFVSAEANDKYTVISTSVEKEAFAVRETISQIADMLINIANMRV